MAKFQKRPVVIDAMQLLPVGSDPTDDYLDAFHTFLEGCDWESDYDEGILIHTLEGDMRANPEDWIIRGVKGEYYPCKPDIFTATYTSVSPQPDLSVERRAQEIYFGWAHNPGFVPWVDDGNSEKQEYARYLARLERSPTQTNAVKENP